VGGEISQSLNSNNGVLVDTAGNVALPLVGRVNVAGLSQTQASERIRQKYKKYLNDPSIYVEVLNKRLFVMGEVKNPGVIKIDKEKMTLFEALATAGDLTDAAVRKEIMIFSNSSIGMHIRTVELTILDTMKYSDLMLRPNDIVYVKPNKWKKFRVASDDMTSPFVTITKVMAPFVTLTYLFRD
jgi:polysaccharide export outer membrane protein